MTYSSFCSCLTVFISHLYLNSVHLHIILSSRILKFFNITSRFNLFRFHCIIKIIFTIFRISTHVEFVNFSGILADWKIVFILVDDIPEKEFVFLLLILLFSYFLFMNNCFHKYILVALSIFIFFRLIDFKTFRYHFGNYFPLDGVLENIYHFDYFLQIR